MAIRAKMNTARAAGTSAASVAPCCAWRENQTRAAGPLANASKLAACGPAAASIRISAPACARARTPSSEVACAPASHSATSAPSSNPARKRSSAPSPRHELSCDTAVSARDISDRAHAANLPASTDGSLGRARRSEACTMSALSRSGARALLDAAGAASPSKCSSAPSSTTAPVIVPSDAAAWAARSEGGAAATSSAFSPAATA
mmetsp:Transcript_11017/g.34179  ORF Transcript_11017/g.34179 Transcript_11017/m.34179 type:complete len:205 (+) Transcript_11017:816-1430(+)